ncbi:MAG: methyltransferase domain-containing protein [Candidatus Cryosericum sp.]
MSAVRTQIIPSFTLSESACGLQDHDESLQVPWELRLIGMLQKGQSRANNCNSGFDPVAVRCILGIMPYYESDMTSDDWTVSYFDDTYRRLFLDTVTEARTRAQVQAILRIVPLLPDSVVLDVGCGLGRHSIEFASLGFRVTGIDMNADYVAACRARCLALGVPADFFVADARSMQLSLRADLVLSLWSSFGYYGEDGDGAILCHMAAHMNTGARLFLDVENGDYVIRHFVAEEWHETGGEVIVERRRLNVVEGTVCTRRLVVSPSSRTEYHRTLRMYTPAELSRLLQLAGLHVEGWYGDYDESRLGSESKRMIAVAVK